MAASRDKLLTELIVHITGLKRHRLQKELRICRNITYRVQSVRPLKNELEARFWQLITVCKDHSQMERADHLQSITDEALVMIDNQPPTFMDTLQFLLELSPGPLEYHYVERRVPFEVVQEQISFQDSLILEQGVPGALGDSDEWSSADSIEGGDQFDGKQLTETEFLPPTEVDIADIGERDLIPFYTIQDERTRKAFQCLFCTSPAESQQLQKPLKKFQEGMEYLRSWLSQSMEGRSLTFQAFAEAIYEEVNNIRRDLCQIEKIPDLTMLRLIHLVQERMEVSLKRCVQICETINPQPEPWQEAVNVLSYIGNENFFLKVATPMLLQIKDLLVKGEFHEELLFDKNPQGEIIVKGPLPETMFLHTLIDRLRISAHCAHCYKENTGKALIDINRNSDAIDIIGRMDVLLKKNIPVQKAAKAAILPLCKLVNTVLVERLENEYDAFRVLKRHQYHSFFVSNEMHLFAEMVFDQRCAREVSDLERCLEDVVGPEWKIRSLEPLVIKDLLPWPHTLFTCFKDNYIRVRTYIFRVKEAAHALIHWDVRELPPDIQLARVKLMCVMDLLNQHITLTAQECIAHSDIATGKDIEEISKKHAAWFEKTQVRTLMGPKIVRNALDDLAQVSLRFIRDQDLSLIDKKFVPLLAYLTKSIGESLPVLAARLWSAQMHF